LKNKKSILGIQSFQDMRSASVTGTSHLDIVKMFNDDPNTEAFIMIGEIGGSAEEEAAEWIGKKTAKSPSPPPPPTWPTPSSAACNAADTNRANVMDYRAGIRVSGCSKRRSATAGIGTATALIERRSRG
jgi:hypothetical protein